MENKNNTAAQSAKENDLSISGRQGITGIEQPEDSNDKVENLKNKADEVKEKVTNNLSGAADKVHTRVDSAQEFLDEKTDKAGELAKQAAAKANEYAHQTIDKANQIGQKAATAISSSSDYIRNFDLEETKQQVKESFKEKPELTVAIAGIFGLLIGLLIGRKSK